MLPAQEAACDRDPRLEIAVAGDVADTAFGFGNAQDIALADAEFGEEFLWKDDANRAADGGGVEG